MKKEVIATQNAPAAIGPYVQALKCGSFIYTSGQLPINTASGKIDTFSIAEQAECALTNLQAVLQAAGAALKDVVKTTVFLSDMNNFPQLNDVYSRFFHESKPARSTVEVARLPLDALVEIEAIAIIE